MKNKFTFFLFLLFVPLLSVHPFDGFVYISIISITFYVIVVVQRTFQVGQKITNLLASNSKRTTYWQQVTTLTNDYIINWRVIINRVNYFINNQCFQFKFNLIEETQKIVYSGQRTPKNVGILLDLVKLQFPITNEIEIS